MRPLAKTFREAIMKKQMWGVSLAVLVAAFGSVMETKAQTGSTGLSIDGRIGVSAAIALADGHIQSMVRSLQLLAITEEVGSGNWERMRGLLAKFKEVQIPAVVFFALPDGSYYTVEKGKTDQNIKDRAYFPRVMAGKVAIGDLVVSRSTGKKVMVAAVPVKSGGKVIGALGVSVHLDKMSELLARELQLPPNMVLYAIDKQGTTALHSVTRLIFEDPAKQKSETLTRAVKEMLSKEEGMVTYEFEGKRKKAYFKTSPLTGWRFALAVTTARSE
jgi:hypothetical protein